MCMISSQLAAFKYCFLRISLKRILLSDVPPYFQCIECIALTELQSSVITPSYWHKIIVVRCGPFYKGWKSAHCLSCLLICLNFGFHEYPCLRFWNLLFVRAFFFFFFHIKSNSMLVCSRKMSSKLHHFSWLWLLGLFKHAVLPLWTYCSWNWEATFLSDLLWTQLFLSLPTLGLTIDSTKGCLCFPV